MPKASTLPDENEALVRLRLITHSARLVDSRKKRGMTGEDMAQAASISRERLGKIENLRVIPKEEEQIKIACVLEKPIDYLFPETLLSAINEGVFHKRKAELNTPRVKALTASASHQLLSLSSGEEMIREVDRKLLAEKLREILKTLDPREQTVLKLRFGLEGECSHTLKEVARNFGLGITLERIRQIEAKALRKLRHPSRSKKLKDFLE